MRRRSFLASLGLAAAALATTFVTPDVANAQLSPGARPGTWQLVFSHPVAFHLDRDTVRLPQGNDRYRAIKLRVRHDSVEFFDLKVVFGNGEVQDFPIRSVIPRRGETRVIALAGGRARHVREIVMTYKSRPSFKGKAVVEVWGEH